MDELDKKILNIIQSDFPLVSSPYEELSKKLGISEESLIERLEKMMEHNIISSIGPVFSSKALGYKSTLVAMKVPHEKFSEVINIINSYSQVTHNYGRNHSYNIWFTLISSSNEEIEQIIEEIKSKTGIKNIFNLPYKKLFKIKVNFSF